MVWFALGLGLFIGTTIGVLLGATLHASGIETVREEAYNEGRIDERLAQESLVPFAAGLDQRFGPTLGSFIAAHRADIKQRYPAR